MRYALLFLVLAGCIDTDAINSQSCEHTGCVAGYACACSRPSGCHCYATVPDGFMVVDMAKRDLTPPADLANPCIDVGTIPGRYYACMGIFRATHPTASEFCAAWISGSVPSVSAMYVDSAKVPTSGVFLGNVPFARSSVNMQPVCLYPNAGPVSPPPIEYGFAAFGPVTRTNSGACSNFPRWMGCQTGGAWSCGMPPMRIDDVTSQNAFDGVICQR